MRELPPDWRRLGLRPYHPAVALAVPFVIGLIASDPVLNNCAIHHFLRDHGAA